MKKISCLNIYVGEKTDIITAKDNGMFVVNAIRNCNGYECHQSIVGWKGRGCPKDHADYYYKQTESCLYLNLIDTDDVKFIPDTIINKTIEIIEQKLNQGITVFICCSLGESRSPSLALIYMLDNNLIDTDNCVEIFKNEYYQKYKPKRGYVDYIAERFCK